MNSFRSLRGSIAILAAGVVARAGAAALSVLPDASAPYVTVQLDNDLFFKTDDNYTNGARLSWVSGRKSARDFNAVQQWLRKLSGDRESIGLIRRLTGFSDLDNLEYKYGLSLTQLMYTPTNRTALTAPKGERPYAGWLGLGFSIHVQDAHALNTVELSLGTTGPHALAHEAQDFVHDLRGFDKFLGWDSQLGNALTGNLFFTQSRRLRYSTGRENWTLDGFWEWGFSLGTFRTDALVGGMFRGGWNLPIDFSDPRLSLRSYSHQMPEKRAAKAFKGLSYYWVAGWRAYAVGRDCTLDGSIFRNERPAVTSEWAVGEAYLGGGVRYECLELCYTDTYRTREFHEQNHAQKYGSVTLRIRL